MTPIGTAANLRGTTVELPRAGEAHALNPGFGALVMYAVQTAGRSSQATIGASTAMLLLSFILAAADPANQGPAWLAAVAGTLGVTGGIGSIIYRLVQDWREKARDDQREANALARLDAREREFVQRMDRAYREHREQIREELADHQKRLDALNTEIAEAGARRHKWANEKNHQILEMEERLQEQAREIERLKLIIANGDKGTP